MFGPKRNHVMFIFERVIRDFGLLILYILLYIFLRDVQILMDNAAFAVIALFMPVTRAVKYFTTYFTIDDEKLVVKSGLLRKEVQEIPLANITSVDFTQPLVLQIAKVYGINVENAGSLGSSDRGNVRLVLKESDALVVKQLLLAKRRTCDAQQETPNARGTYAADFKDLVMMGFMQSKAMVLIIQMLAYAGVITGIVSKIIGRRELDRMEAILLAYGALLVLAAFIALYLVSTIISAVIEIVKYYDFKVTDRGNALFIEYGIFTKKSLTVMKSKISGIHYRQSLSMKFLRRGTLELFAAGYGGLDDDTAEESVMLYPVMSERKLYGFIDAILPGAVEPPVFEEAPKKSLPYFFMCFRFAAAAVLFVGSFAVRIGSVTATAFVLLILAVISVVLEYRNSAVSADTKMIVFRNGGFCRHTMLLVRDKIESVEDTASNRKRHNAGISSVTVGVLAANQYSTHRVRNMPIDVFEKLKGRLIY